LTGIDPFVSYLETMSAYRTYLSTHGTAIGEPGEEITTEREKRKRGKHEEIDRYECSKKKRARVAGDPLIELREAFEAEIGTQQQQTKPAAEPSIVVEYPYFIHTMRVPEHVANSV
jgi:hypothetical protein